MNADGRPKVEIPFLINPGENHAAKIAKACGVDFLALLTEEFGAEDFRRHLPDVRILTDLKGLTPYLT